MRRSLWERHLLILYKIKLILLIVGFGDSEKNNRDYDVAPATWALRNWVFLWLVFEEADVTPISDFFYQLLEKSGHFRFRVWDIKRKKKRLKLASSSSCCIDFILKTSAFEQNGWFRDFFTAKQTQKTEKECKPKPTWK